jgi:hypothetical protein
MSPVPRLPTRPHIWKVPPPPSGAKLGTVFTTWTVGGQLQRKSYKFVSSNFTLKMGNLVIYHFCIFEKPFSLVINAFFFSLLPLLSSFTFAYSLLGLHTTLNTSSHWAHDFPVLLLWPPSNSWPPHLHLLPTHLGHPLLYSTPAALCAGSCMVQAGTESNRTSRQGRELAMVAASSHDPWTPRRPKLTLMWQE